LDNLTNLGLLLPRFIIEMVAALFCGAALGIERGAAKRGIGLRETTLLTLGACLMMMVGELADLSTGEGGVATDPGRLSGFVIVAGGLIAAGAAMRRQKDIAPLGASATVWICIGVGLLIGTGYPLLGILVTFGVVLALLLVRGVDRHLTAKPRPLLLRLTVREDSPELRQKLQLLLAKQGIHPDNIRAETIPNGIKVTISAAHEPADIRPLLSAIWTIPGVAEVEH